MRPTENDDLRGMKAVPRRLKQVCIIWRLRKTSLQYLHDSLVQFYSLRRFGTVRVVRMINAVLVFNNNGQPRLTKFYTQLVGRSLAAVLCC